jgi:hypothetical protein
LSRNVDNYQSTLRNIPEKLRPEVLFLCADFIKFALDRVELCLLFTRQWHFFFSYNQQDALIIQIYFYKTLVHVSDIFSAHHQEFSTVHSALILLGSGHQKPA